MALSSVFGHQNVSVYLSSLVVWKATSTHQHSTGHFIHKHNNLLGNRTSALTNAAKMAVKWFFFLTHIQTGADSDHPPTCSPLGQVSELNRCLNPPIFRSPTNPPQSSTQSILQVWPSQQCAQPFSLQPSLNLLFVDLPGRRWCMVF